MTPSKIFLYLCLAFAAGVFLDSILQFSLLLILGLLILGVSFICVFWQYKKFVVFGFCVLFLVLGVWRHNTAESKISNNELSRYNDSGEIVTITGVVAKEPDIRTSSTDLEIKSLKIESGGKTANISGNMMVIAGRYPEYQYGDELEVSGKLETPSADIEGFNYKEYLSKDGIYSQMFWPQITKVAQGKGNPVYSSILSFKEKLRSAIYQNLSPPQSSILGAVILGDKRQLSENLKNELNIAGVRHITAVSGMHIAILAGILMYLGLALGLWRGQVFYFAVIFLVLYIIMVGAPASAVRAGIMGGIFLLGQRAGRLSASSRALIFVGAVMLFQNPLILRLDVGFQLSFLAVAGIIYLMPHMQAWLSKIPNPRVVPLRDLIAMTISAQVFTLPILIYNFGYFSSVAPITNILIVPLLPYVMVLGFVFGLAGTILPALGWILSWISWLLLTYMVKVIGFFSALTFAQVNFSGINWVWIIFFYLAMGIIIWRLGERQKLKFLQY